MKFSHLLILNAILAGTLSFGLAESSHATSKLPKCEDVMHRTNLKVGTACVHKLEIFSGKADWPKGRESGRVQYTSPSPEWMISFVSSPKEKSVNYGKIENLQMVAYDERSEIQNQLAQLNQEIYKTRRDFQTESVAVVKGMPVPLKKGVKTLLEDQKVNQTLLDQFSKVSSNVAKVDITATAQGVCKATVLGKCVDGVGGWYRGYVDIHHVYVGNVDAHIATTKAKVLDINKQVEDFAAQQATQSQREAEQENEGIEKQNNTVDIAGTPNNQTPGSAAQPDNPRVQDQDAHANELDMRDLPGLIQALIQMLVNLFGGGNA